MFCQNCGAELPEGAKFCGNCGTLNAFAEQKNEAPAQPVNSFAGVPTPVPDSAPNVQNVQSAQPAQDYSYAQNTQAMPYGNTAQPVQPIQQNTANPTDRLMNEYYHAAGSQQAASGAAYQPVSEPQPMRYTEATAVPVAPKKKKSKLVPGICIAAGSVVVLGGAAFAVYHFNKAAVTHMLMGDTNYAYSIAASAITGAVGDSGMDGVSAVRTFNSTMTAATELSETGSYGSDMQGQFDAMGTALEAMTGCINEAAGVDGVSISMTGSAELDPSVIEMVRSAAESSGVDGATVEDFLNNLDSIRFTVAEKDSGSAYEYSTKITAGDDSVVEAQIRYEEDGTFTMVFPGISDIGITAKLPEHSWDTSKQNAPEAFDFAKLSAKLGAELKEEFSKYEIRCENSSADVGGLEFNGMTVEISIDKDELCDICQIVVNVLKDDEEFEEYLRSMDSSVDDMVSGLTSSIDNIRSSSADFTGKLIYYVNSDNTIAGGKFSVEAGQSGYTQDITFEALSRGNDSEISVSSSGMELFAVHTKGTSANSGRTEITANGLTGSVGGSISVYVDYQGVGKTNVFGIPTAVGSYKVSVSSGTASLMSGGNSEIAGIIANSSITVSAVPQGKGIAYSLGVDISGYGKGSITITLDEASGDVAPKPGSNYTMIDIENASAENAAALSEDFMKHFEELANKNKLIGAVYKMIQYNSLVRSELPEIDYYESGYGDYNDDDYSDYFNDFYDDYGDFDDFDYGDFDFSEYDS